MKILAVSGSLRAGSHNTQLLRAATEAAPEGVEVEVWEGIGDLPLYDQDLELRELPAPVRRNQRRRGSSHSQRSQIGDASSREPSPTSAV